MQKIINNQPFNHVMFAGCIVCTCTMLDEAINIPSDVVTWNNLQLTSCYDVMHIDDHLSCDGGIKQKFA